ncbi:MAG: ATP-binding protein [Anaerolineae bacterium]|nr:ATP-binding protein [Anaerolineae bacterium]
MNQKSPDSMRRFYLKVNTRITLPFLLITIIVAGLGVFAVTRLITTTIDEYLSQQLINSAQAAENAIVTLETEQLAALRSMVFTEGVAEAIIANDSETLNELIPPIVANNLIDTAIVFDANGNILYSVGFDIFAGRLVNNPIRDGFQLNSVSRVLDANTDGLGDKFVDVVADGTSYQLYISAPVVLENDRTIGAIAIGLRSNRIIRRLTEQSLASIIIYDEEGNILGTTFVAADESDITITAQQIVQFRAQVEDYSPISEITVAQIPYRTLYTDFDIRSQRIGFMAIALPTNFVIQQISVSRNIFIALFGGLFLVVAIIGIIVTRSIVKPITRLVDAARAIREGDLSHRTDLKLADELGELSTSFDQMTDHLVARHQEVEDLYVQQLEETTRRDAILSSISDAVLVRGTGDKILLANPAARDLIDSVRPHADEYRTFYNLQAQPHLLTEPRKVTLRDKHYSVLATPVMTQSQENLGYILLFRDITAMVEAERLKDEVILQLAHELRTPLSSVRSYVELIQLNENVHNQQNQNSLDKTIEQLQILEHRANQVIDVSAILTHDLHLEIANVNITTLIDDIADKYYPHLEAKKQHIGFNFPQEDVIIEGDVRQLQDVLDHLIHNASTYTREGGWIEVTVEQNASHVDIFIVDNGVGIADDALERVFDHLYHGQSDTAKDADTQGLGLGLYISREIVQAHHGSIKLRSQRDVGTMVTVTLPNKQQSE